MSAELRGSAYRAALSEAYVELDQICERIAQLRTRKEQLERASVALQSMMGAAAQQQPVATHVEVQEVVAAPAQAPAPAPAPVFEMPVHAPVAERRRESSADPLQRHIDQALGMAALA